MLLVMDVGNTTTMLGVYDGVRRVAQWRLATSRARTVDEYGVLTSGLFAAASLVTPVLLLSLLRRGMPSGTLLFVFCVLWPVGQLAVEQLRADPRPPALATTIPAVVLLVTCTVCAGSLLRRLVTGSRRGGLAPPRDGGLGPAGRLAPVRGLSKD